MLKQIAVCLVVAAAATGCAARGTVRQVDIGSGSSQAAFTGSGETSSDSLEVFMGKVRARSERARPMRTSGLAKTLEASDVALAAALFAVTVHPTPENHRAVAQEYLRLEISDLAHDHFSAAAAADPKDAAAWEGMARIWRDWGLPHVALPDAYRAVYYAPDSPVVHNTLGTVLQALGRGAAARSHYEKALALDASAAYALTNLCYGWVLDREPAKAVEACRQALQLQPDLEAARNNLALAYEAGGNLSAALETFASAGDGGSAEYNAGMVHLARGRYIEALQAFELARVLRPQFREAEVMARYALRQAVEERKP